MSTTIALVGERGFPGFFGYDLKEPAELRSRFFMFGGLLAPGAGWAKPPSLSTQAAFGIRLFLTSGEAKKIIPKAKGHQSCANNDFSKKSEILKINRKTRFFSIFCKEKGPREP